MDGWNTTWLNMPKIALAETRKFQEVVNSKEKLFIIKESFQHISQQMQ